MELKKYLKLAIILFVWFGLLAVSGSLLAQEQTDAQSGDNAAQPTEVDNEGAVKISNILVDNFETADRWFGSMSVDNGLIQVQKRKGAVKEIRDADPEQAKFVLGAKVNFFKAGIFEASIEPPNPIIIPGYTKKLAVWAYGRSYQHTLYAVVRDFKGRLYKFTFGKLNFYGWKKLEANIPNDPAYPFFSQIDVARQTFFQTHGITFVGFLIEFDPKESKGRFYVYLDQFEAESNVHLYEQELQVKNIPEDERLEPIDNW